MCPIRTALHKTAVLRFGANRRRLCAWVALAMLSDLTAIAAELGLSFLHGDDGQINVLIDDVQVFPLMYAEGYGEGTNITNPDTGHDRDEYDVTVWLILESEQADHPDTKSARLDALQATRRRIIKMLRKVAELPERIPFKTGIDINGLDKPADGIRFSFTATPYNQPKVCL